MRKKKDPSFRCPFCGTEQPREVTADSLPECCPRMAKLKDEPVTSYSDGESPNSSTMSGTGGGVRIIKSARNLGG